MKSNQKTSAVFFRVMTSQVLASVVFSAAAFSGGVFSAPALQAATKEVTMEGTIDKIVPEKKEIYVIADGKKHEFYFNEKTQLVKAGTVVGFETLKKSMKVRVTADKVGKRLDPLKVELLD